MVKLEYLYLHDNLLTELPRDISRLSQTLKEFSSEWFVYSKPSHPKILKQPDAIKQFIEFLKHFGSQPTTLERAHSPSLMPPGHKRINSSSVNFSELGEVESEECSFMEYIVYFHRLNKQKPNLKSVEFSMKKRSLLQMIVSNQHWHLVKHVLSEAEVDLSYTDSDGRGLLCQCIMQLSMSDCNEKKLQIIEYLLK